MISLELTEREHAMLMCAIGLAHYSMTGSMPEYAAALSAAVTENAQDWVSMIKRIGAVTGEQLPLEYLESLTEASHNAN